MTFPRTILAVCTSVVLIAPVPSVAASTVAYVTGPPPCTTTGAQRPAQTAQQANQAAYSAMALQRQEAAMFGARRNGERLSGELDGSDAGGEFAAVGRRPDHRDAGVAADRGERKELARRLDVRERRALEAALPASRRLYPSASSLPRRR
jgi:hypothetical protein